MEIKLTVKNEDVEKFIREVMENWPDYNHAGGGLDCIKADHKECKYTFVDVEDEKEKFEIDLPKLLKGMEKLLKDVYETGKIDWDSSVGTQIRTIVGESFGDETPAYMDADGLNALVEYTIYGEIIFC